MSMLTLKISAYKSFYNIHVQVIFLIYITDINVYISSSAQSFFNVQNAIMCTQEFIFLHMP